MFKSTEWELLAAAFERQHKEIKAVFDSLDAESRTTMAGMGLATAGIVLARISLAYRDASNAYIHAQAKLERTTKDNGK